MSVPKFGDWFRAIPDFLRLRFGAPTGRVALLADSKAISLAAARSGALTGFEASAHTWPDPVPRPESTDGAADLKFGSKGLFTSRLRQLHAVGSRPFARVIVDAVNGSVMALRLVGGQELQRLRTGRLLRETLEHNQGELFPTLQGVWRWEVLTPNLELAPEGEADSFLVVGLAENYCSAVETWAEFQGLGLDSIVPLPLVIARWIAGAVPNAVVVGSFEARRAFRMVLVNGAVRLLELLGSPYDEWTDFEAHVSDLAAAGGLPVTDLAWLSWGGSEEREGIHRLEGPILNRLGGEKLPSGATADPRTVLLAWAATTPRFF